VQVRRRAAPRDWRVHATSLGWCCRCCGYGGGGARPASALLARPPNSHAIAKPSRKYYLPHRCQGNPRTGQQTRPAAGDLSQSLRQHGGHWHEARAVRPSDASEPRGDGFCRAGRPARPRAHEQPQPRGVRLCLPLRALQGNAALCRLPPRPLTRKRGAHVPCTLRSTPSTGS